MYTLTLWLAIGVLACAVDAIWSAWVYQWERDRIERKWQLWEADYNRVMKHQQWKKLQKEQEEWKSN